ncbi:MAG: division/cell wall cluster transcriptional repressor MraZ [Actinomycetota bacterium]|nr:division/cell wall cluster transcriptional repressor MraZ [Actinomycetota bacterium]
MFDVAFRGTFDFTLDAKNRLTVPARFRAALSDGVVLAAGIERCVAVWTSGAYESQVSAALQASNPVSPRARDTRRFFSANAHETELDAAGRVMLPPFLVDHAGLDREVVVIGAEECLEVWGRDAWAQYNRELTGRMNEITESLDHPS